MIFLCKLLKESDNFHCTDLDINEASNAGSIRARTVQQRPPIIVVTRAVPNRVKFDLGVCRSVNLIDDI